MKKSILVILICALALLVLTACFDAIRVLGSGNDFVIHLEGERRLYVEYGEQFLDPGAVVEWKDGQKTSPIPIDVNGEVDVNRIGCYPIKYVAKYGNRIVTEHRYVYVVDKQAPVIMLVEDPNSYTLMNEPYAEAGYTATDNYDGDLTEQVIRKENDGVVTYTVTDSFGNTTTVERVINYVDTGIPNLQLTGGQTAFIIAGEPFEEPGYSATDIKDGDLTSSVVVSGAVDNLTSGVYTLQYTVSNSLGMSAKKDRTIYVIPRQEPAEESDGSLEDTPEVDIPTGGTTIVPNGKTIYLTFDDGPSAHTKKLLDVLAKYDVKATFFVIKTSYIDVIERAAREGHSIAIHSFTHRYSDIYSSDEAFMADLLAMQNLIYQHTGQTVTLIRFPGGSSNSVSKAYNKGIMTRLTKELEMKGYQYFDWNVDSNDAGGAKTADEVFENVINGIGNRTNSVVLQHDSQGFSVDAVERIIAWGLCNGYTFAPLTADSPACHHGLNN